MPFPSPMHESESESEVVSDSQRRHGLNLPGSSGHGIVQARVLEWVAIAFSSQGLSVQFSSVAQLCPTLCDPVNRSKPGLPVHHKLLEFTQTHAIESVTPSSHLILCRPLLLPTIPPSIRVFSNELTLHISWPKYWSFSFSISPSNEHPGLISFRIDWLDLPAVQGTLKSLSNTTVQKHQFFSAQLSSQSNSHIHA